MKNVAILSTPWPPILNKPPENICLLQRGQHWSSMPLHSSREVEDEPVLLAELLPGNAGVAVGNFWAPTFFVTAAGAAMSHTAPSRALAGEGPLCSPLFPLQLPHLTAQDRWKMCRDSELQEHIWVLIFYLVTLERAKYNMQNQGRW